MKTSTSEFNVYNESAIRICKLPRFATTGKVLFALADLSDQDNIVHVRQSTLSKLLELSAVAVNRAIRTLKREDFIRQYDYYGWMLNPTYIFHGTAKKAAGLVKEFEALPKYESSEN